MIHIVGNVIKDIYLSLDPRTEHFEADASGTSWLDLSFDSSLHHFYHRVSTFGGAAVSLEVLKNLGQSAIINNSDLFFDGTGPVKLTPASSYRYILTLGDSASYFTQSEPTFTTFNAPDTPPDYLYIDRSARLQDSTVSAISAFLEAHPRTRLILYLESTSDATLLSLASRAALIFTETPSSIADLASVPHKNIVFLSCDAIAVGNITEPLSVDRINKRTHLSLFSIISSTIIACFISGRSIEESLRLARLNVENSPLDSTLTLDELKSLEVPTSDRQLELIAATLMTRGKGILAADESGGSIKRKFADLDIPDDYPHRHAYRNIFFTTKGIENYLSGVILFDETARDHMDNRTAIPDYLTSLRIIPGIKVDEGLVPLEGTTETITKGLDGLKSRLRTYHEMGLRFAKWRAAFNITLDDAGNLLTPTPYAIRENCKALALYAVECQSAGLVPIVEPEVVYDGDYDIATCTSVTSDVLDILTEELTSHHVNLHACIYKINLISNGKRYKTASTPEEIASATSVVLSTHVPLDLAGVVFLSGGHSPEASTACLARIIEKGPYPFPVTFSFARALQDPALHAWAGDRQNTEKARQAFLDRLIANKEALG